jgi:predicted metal-binding membrane protein
VVERESARGAVGGPILSTTRQAQSGGSVSRRDLYVVTGSLVLLSAVAWLYVVREPDDDMAVGVLTRPDSTDPMSAMDMGAGMSLTIFMTTWVVMMVAMMFPATAPVVLVFDRWRRARHRTPSLTVSFVLGYLAVWTAAGLSVYAALMVIEDYVTSSENAVRVGGATLVAAGLYQLSPLKSMCLTKCRSPLTLVMKHAQQLGRGLLGPLQVGVVHGAYCLGCCWALMAILVVLGLMNLGWMAAVSALILVEKVLPAGHIYGRIVGVGIAVAGATVLITGSGLGA